MKKFGNKTVQGNKILMPKDTVLFGSCCVVFYALGSYFCSYKGCIGSFSSCFCPSFGREFDWIFFFVGWLFSLIPLVTSFLSGYSYLGNLYSSLSIAFRSYLSGYSCFAVISSCFNYFGGIVLFSAYTIVEALILLTVVSSAVEQKRFRLCYCISKTTPFSLEIGKLYIKNFFIRVGILALLFIVRTVICTFIVLS